GSIEASLLPPSFFYFSSLSFLFLPSMSVVFFQRGHSWSFVLDEGVTWEPTRKAIPNSPADL
ncbi:hypothetical protein S83_055423, partial [Arachis hypogaea]